MKMIAGLALIAAQLAVPAQAAELAGERGQLTDSRMGAFVGARLRVGLGSGAQDRTRLGLTAAPIHQAQYIDGKSRRRFAEGLELGVAGRESPRLSVAGLRIGEGCPADTGKRRLGLSTLEAAGIVGGVIVLGFVVVALVIRDDVGCCE
jgi:hypothetical protein